MMPFHGVRIRILGESPAIRATTAFHNVNYGKKGNHATLLCKCLKHSLEDGIKKCKVHSVFKRAVNLLCGDAVITLLAAGRCLYPFSCLLNNVQDFTELGIQCGTGAEIACSGVRIPTGDFAADFSGAELINLSIWQNGPYIMPDDLIERLQLLTQTLERYGKADSLGCLVTCDVYNSYANLIARHLPQLSAALRSGSLNGVAEAASNVAGCGIGLTPSSDDLMVGWLVSFAAMCIAMGSRQKHVRALVRAASHAMVSRTTQISAAFLQRCGEGLVCQDLLNLLHTLYSNASYEALTKDAKTLLQLGATSGVDILTGVILGAKALLKDE